MRTLVIYFDAEGRNRQILRPPGELKGNKRAPFNGSWGDVVDTITLSDRDTGRKNYHHWEVVE